MTLSVGRSGVGLGHWGMSYEFTNHADACALEGYPVLLGLNDNGQWETVVVRQSTNAYIPPPPPMSGPLARGDIAAVTLQGTERSSYPNNECPTAPKQPPTYRALRFVLPGDATPLQVDADFNGGCDLTVSPFGAKEQTRSCRHGVLAGTPSKIGPSWGFNETSPSSACTQRSRAATSVAPRCP